MVLLIAAAALAATPVLDVSLGASYWPEGLKLSARPGLKLPLWNKEGNVLFEDTWVRGRVVADVTPSYGRIGPEIAISPIAVLELMANYQVSPYFGTFSSIKALQTPGAVADDATLDPLANHTGLTHRVTTEVTLQGKVGPIVVAVYGGPQWWWTHSDAETDGGYWWEPETELVMAWTDRTLSGTGVLLYEHVFDADRGQKLYAGGYGEWRNAAATEDQIARAGLMGVFSPDKRFTVVVLVLAQIEHRVETVPFPPYVAAQVRWYPLEKKPVKTP